MDNSTIMYIVVGLLAIAFIVFTIFNAKTWRFLHVVAALFVFAASLIFIFLSAATLRTHETWRAAYNNLAEKVSIEQQQQDELLYGSLSEIEQTKASIRSVEQALRRALLDRGSVWRGCTPEIVDNTVNVTVITAAPDPDAGVPDEGAPDAGGEPPADGEAAADSPAPAPATPRRHNIEQDTIIYAFLEGPSEVEGDWQGKTVPKTYLGEYRVVSRTDTTVALQPVIPPNQRQLQGLAAGGSWTLYANMPIDSHTAFAGLSREQLEQLFPRDQMTMSEDEYTAKLDKVRPYFTGIDAALPDGFSVQSAIPKSSMAMDDAEYAQFINEYLMDGQPVENPAAIEPDQIWKKVEFVKEHSIPVDDAAAGEGLANFRPENFNAQGMAVNQHLKQGEPTEFDIGDEGIFDPKTADKLIADGIAKEVGLVYRRRLRDYAIFFQDVYREELVYQDVFTVLQLDTRTMLGANTSMQSNLTVRMDELTKLAADKEGFERERDALAELLSKQLRPRHLASRKRLSQLYQQNLLLAERIRNEQLRRAAEINRGAAEEDPQPEPPAADTALSSP